MALALLVIVVLWGGSFGYAMYLAFAAIRNGDRRLLRRGVAGAAAGPVPEPATGPVTRAGAGSVNGADDL